MLPQPPPELLSTLAKSNLFEQERFRRHQRCAHLTPTHGEVWSYQLESTVLELVVAHRTRQIFHAFVDSNFAIVRPSGKVGPKVFVDIDTSGNIHRLTVNARPAAVIRTAITEYSVLVPGSRKVRRSPRARWPSIDVRYRDGSEGRFEPWNLRVGTRKDMLEPFTHTLMHASWHEKRNARLGSDSPLSTLAALVQQFAGVANLEWLHEEELARFRRRSRYSTSELVVPRTAPHTEPFVVVSPPEVNGINPDWLMLLPCVPRAESDGLSNGFIPIEPTVPGLDGRWSVDIYSLSGISSARAHLLRAGLPPLREHSPVVWEQVVLGLKSFLGVIAAAGSQTQEDAIKSEPHDV